MIHPHQLAKWQRRFPFHYDCFVQLVADDAQQRRGRNDLEFVLACNRRAIQLMVEVVCATASAGSLPDMVGG
jgi:hypothetical protein